MKGLGNAGKAARGTTDARAAIFYRLWLVLGLSLVAQVAAVGLVLTDVLPLPGSDLRPAAGIAAVLLPGLLLAWAAVRLVDRRVHRLTTAAAETEQRTREVATELVGVLEALSQGDLSRRMAGTHDGPFRQIGDDYNNTVGKLSAIVRRIEDVAQAVDQSSREISAGSLDLAERTEQQAAFLEQTAASIEEINASIHLNAENVRRVRDLAAEASLAAENGTGVADRAMAAMRRIDQSASRITEITAAIDEIAFQTNLLALNAAVEAARAGEAGRGFAVVAQEVRSLSQRSGASSKEIKALIQESAAHVSEGVKQVAATGTTLAAIARDIKGVSTLIAEIAVATSEQAVGVDEINTAASRMEEMTQKNAALVEESAGVAQSMAEEAAELHQQIAFFALDPDAASETGRSPARTVQLVESFKIDHVRFVEAIRKSIAGGGGVTSGNLADCHSCRLGKWYDRVADPVLRSSPHFAALNDPHCRLHEQGRRTLEAAERGDQVTAGQLFTDVERVSAQVIEHLDCLVQDVKARLKDRKARTAA